MSKQDYVAIATVLERARADALNAGWSADTLHEMIAKRLASTFADANPRFDIARFLHASDVSGY